jgi:hypothetical protein
VRTAARLAEEHGGAGGVLRMRRLCVTEDHDPRTADNADALLAALRGHGALTQLCVTDVELPPERAVELCDLVLEKRLTVLCIYSVYHAPTATIVPALARLLREGRLVELALRAFEPRSLWREPPVQERRRARAAPPRKEFPLPTRCAAECEWRDLCAAIRASSTLRRLTLSGVLAGERWVLGPLVHAVTAHPALQELSFSETRNQYSAEEAHLEDAPPDYGASRWVPDALSHGRALSRIIAANAPSLRSLCYDSYLGEPGLEAALPALAANTHLQLLGVRCVQRAYISPIHDQPPTLHERFVADVMRPALCASASLRAVRFVPYDESLPDEQDAENNAEDALKDASERDKAAQRLRNALAALADEVAAQHDERHGARDWARAASRWAAAATPAATPAQH